ncbi:MAG: hypothetical protein GY842_13755 [bacterium]|nr:hypothetical protein [bacterium]
MTRLIARLVLAMLLLPLTGAVFLLLFTALIAQGTPPEPVSLAAMWIGVYAFIGVYWVALWRSMVRWTKRRTTMTWLMAPLSLGAGAVFGLCFLPMLPTSDPGPAFMLGGGLVPIVWVLATVLIWRETPEERIERLTVAGVDAICCPTCGYNMTGLREARCPECGAGYTLDQLVATQPDRDRTALRDA